MFGCGSVWRMSVKKERSELFNCGRAVRVAVVAVMSFGKISRFGLVVFVGWRDIVSVVLCRTLGMCIIRNR